MSTITAHGHLPSAIAGETIVKGMALKLVSGVLNFTDADTDLCVGWAVQDAIAGENVAYQTDGNVEFIAGEDLTAAGDDEGKLLMVGANGRMFLVTAAKRYYLQWVPQGATCVSTTGDVATGGYGMARYHTGTAAA